VFGSCKPLFELGSGIAAESARTKHGLANTINALPEFFLVAVDFGNLAVQRPDRATDFPEQVQRMVLGLCRRLIL
jgi:hypothetical protein